MKPAKPWWIKQRCNPQSGTYYVACGQMSRTVAAKHEKPIYGDNYMLMFETEQQYKARLSELKASGERVQ